MEQERQAGCGPDVEYINGIVESLKIPGYTDAALAEAFDEDGHRTVVACWSHRGCEGLMGLTKPMQQECPHNRSDCFNPCPPDCRYTVCERPWHRTTSDINLILDETVDRLQAIKRNCLTCEHFLKHGPRVGESREDGAVIPETATSDVSNKTTIHLF
jgi:hypothetical protein